jgi:hypothetical protein
LFRADRCPRDTTEARVKRLVVLWGVAACGPVWPVEGTAPNGDAPWAYPTDDVCLDRDDADAFEVDGFLFCGSDAETRIVAVDEPVLEPCSEVTQSGLVFSVFDGSRAQAYPVALLQGRELVHVNWDGEPLLIDY